MVARIKGGMPLLKDLVRQFFIHKDYILYTLEPVSPWGMHFAHLCSVLRNMLGPLLLSFFGRILLDRT